MGYIIAVECRKSAATTTAKAPNGSTSTPSSAGWQRRSERQPPPPPRKSPYYLYDGTKPIPVFVNVEAPGSGYPTVDEWGVPIETPNSHKVNGIWEVTHELVKIYEKPDALDIIRKEIQRLDALWNAGRT